MSTLTYATPVCLPLMSLLTTSLPTNLIRMISIMEKRMILMTEAKGELPVAEPVAWMFEFPDKRIKPKFDTAPHGGNWVPLYTAQSSPPRRCRPPGPALEGTSQPSRSPVSTNYGEDFARSKIRSQQLFSLDECTLFGYRCASSKTTPIDRRTECM